MSYNTEEIKPGIKLHTIETSKFKTNLLGVFITTPLNRKWVTYNTVIPAVLKRGTANLKTQEEISKKLENMYGAGFDCGVEKIGDNHVMKFYLESLNDSFIPNNASILKQSLNLLLDIILNPLTENNRFKKDYVEAEKENIRRLIEAKIDNKDQYALNRCIEEMYKGKPYGLYKYGYSEDLGEINEENLYSYYIDLINKCKIDIFVSGEINKEEILQIIENNENIQKLNPRDVGAGQDLPETNNEGRSRPIPTRNTRQNGYISRKVSNRNGCRINRIQFKISSFNI